MQTDIIGIDLGGTQLRAGLLSGRTWSRMHQTGIDATAPEQTVLQQLYELIDQCFHPGVEAIGIGVPSMVDPQTGVVYDVVNIPSWKEVPLRALLNARYRRPVFVNNDANCFALGEYYFGKGQAVKSMLGLTIGTGIGAGIILEGKLWSGEHCGAGEIGMIDYLDKNYEAYCSGQFFREHTGEGGEKVFEKAVAGDRGALELMGTFGTHLGNAIKTLLYSYDSDLVVLGGSVSQAFPYFEKAMWARIKTYIYPEAIKKLRVECSDIELAGLLGAAALCYPASRFAISQAIS